MRRNALDAVKLTVFETDAVTGRRSSIVLSQGFIIEGASIFEQLERFLPFDQWETLEIHKNSAAKKMVKSTVYVKKRGENVDEEQAKCKKMLDVERRDEMLTLCSLGHELALFRVSARAAHRQFVIEQSHAWLND